MNKKKKFLLFLSLFLLACQAVTAPLLNSPTAQPTVQATAIATIMPTATSFQPITATPVIVPATQQSQLSNTRCIDMNKESREHAWQYPPHGTERPLDALFTMLADAHVNCAQLVFDINDSDVITIASTWIQTAHQHGMTVKLTLQPDLTYPFDRFKFKKDAVALYSQLQSLLGIGDVVTPLYRADDRTVQGSNCSSNCVFNSAADLGQFLNGLSADVAKVLPSSVFVGMYDFGNYALWEQSGLTTVTMREGFLDSVPASVSNEQLLEAYPNDTELSSEIAQNDPNKQMLFRMARAAYLLKGANVCFGTWGPLDDQPVQYVYDLFYAGQKYIHCTIYATSGPNGLHEALTYFDNGTYHEGMYYQTIQSVYKIYSP